MDITPREPALVCTQRTYLFVDTNLLFLCDLSSIIFALKHRIQSSPCLHVRLDSEIPEERNHVLTVFVLLGFLERASLVAGIQEYSIVLLITCNSCY